jgi:hypothetical protein
MYPEVVKVEILRLALELQDQQEQGAPLVVSFSPLAHREQVPDQLNYQQVQVERVSVQDRVVLARVETSLSALVPQLAMSVPSEQL